ncbi:hypothetical protein C8J27_10239 [Rhodobacter aestuarii]|uniref:Lipoprotein n=1 Tax=Rhodobacter aestuarii TaxID=453582 RepID=A0A1N7N585_9RHOB|nr:MULTISPECIES: hypothetical protein [Rhodobacter]PTV96245.1 hypothetical protein C8J27_10239 [Rhodobacter aestuarii]SIS93522.1 hypothetical protein SAMN05421580_10739 [Rhodobacter aestuarii]SOB93423.1 hypothetical protein SAMN05877809_101693 [Rhodobacter sp. JA431]
MRRLFICMTAPVALAACGAEPVWAPDEAVQAAHYSTGKPPSVTLFTVIGTTTGAGGHSALMIDGSERVIFDPAGTWKHPTVPERNDVDYGITDQMYKFYIDYHSRETWFVREQTLPVSPAIAEALIDRVEANGAVAKMMCANETSAILRDIPGFESIPQTTSPVKLSKAFGQLPGVVTDDHYDNDPDDNSGVLMIQAEPFIHGTNLPY